MSSIDAQAADKAEIESGQVILRFDFLHVATLLFGLGSAITLILGLSALSLIATLGLRQLIIGAVIGLFCLMLAGFGLLWGIFVMVQELLRQTHRR